MNSCRIIFDCLVASARTFISIPCKGYLALKRASSVAALKEVSHAEKVIVSMTSWAKRISNVSVTIDSILRNTILPDLIVLNLSIEEFPNKEKDLPKQLLQYLKSGIIEIIWNEGNTRAFKKIIPTMKRYPHDAIIAIDDDFIYPEDFIETFVNKHKEMPYTPLSGNEVILYGEQAHCGCASLVKRAFFGKYIDDLMDETVLKLGMDDVFYTFCALLNGFHYQNVGKLFFINMAPNNPIDGLSLNSQFDNDDMRVYLARKVREKYHIHMTVLSKPFFV